MTQNYPRGHSPQKNINSSVHKSQDITVHRVKLLTAPNWKYPGHPSMGEETDK